MRPWLVFRSHLKPWMTWTPARYLQTPTSIPSTTPPTRRRNVIHLPLGRLTAAARSLINMHTPSSSSPPPLPRYIPSCASSAIHAHTQKKRWTCHKCARYESVALPWLAVIMAHQGSVVEFSTFGLEKEGGGKKKERKEGTDVAIFSSTPTDCRAKIIYHQQPMASVCCFVFWFFFHTVLTLHLQGAKCQSGDQVEDEWGIGRDQRTYARANHCN